MKHQHACVFAQCVFASQLPSIHWHVIGNDVSESFLSSQSRVRVTGPSSQSRVRVI